MNRGGGPGGRGRNRGYGGFYRPRGRSSPLASNSTFRQSTVVANVNSDEVKPNGNDNLTDKQGDMSVGFSTSLGASQFDEVPDGSSYLDLGKLKLVHDSPEEGSKRSPSQSGSKFDNDHRPPTQFDDGRNDLSLREPEFSQSLENVTTTSKQGTKFTETSKETARNKGKSDVTFDICLEKKGGPPKLKSPLLVSNREKRNEIKRSMGEQATSILRPGMVLLKKFISCSDQVKIVQTCRKLGLGNGGFYQPDYRDGAMLHLKMMCLGKNWDPETSLYEEQRPFDGAEPPPIPSEFRQLVQKAIQDTHAYLAKEVKEKHVESFLPSMSPDICIVNFYTSSGRLGLHKDKDESRDSLSSGLPVVSISIGDSAEFLYGDQRDVEKAEKVILESGDVLIFGGKSRHVYHGVSSILSKTAPEALMQESDLRPGRLNLTFRKY